MYHQWWREQSQPSAPSRLATEGAVLALFAVLAGPITLLQVVNLDIFVLSVLALPGYATVLSLAALCTTVGVGEFVGTPGFYALNVLWGYLLSLALVGTGRYLRGQVQSGEASS